MRDTPHTVVRSEVSVAASEAFRLTNKNREHNLFLFSILCGGFFSEMRLQVCQTPVLILLSISLDSN